ncbi:hypothetical protein CEXT_653141 [Caerostris extrusa]|uniref:Uncharacterized protein n=1 Tax=Caerostris extrusa TaxID=172846 RepID=A0AAV4S3A1_CAEEX|nr:hypothetical protein CEXT_653141 [Caerostris extrusa]
MVENRSLIVDDVFAQFLVYVKQRNSDDSLRCFRAYGRLLDKSRGCLRLLAALSVLMGAYWVEVVAALLEGPYFYSTFSSYNVDDRKLISDSLATLSVLMGAYWAEVIGSSFGADGCLLGRSRGGFIRVTHFYSTLSSYNVDDRKLISDSLAALFGVDGCLLGRSRGGFIRVTHFYSTFSSYNVDDRKLISDSLAALLVLMGAYWAEVGRVY